MNKPVYEEYILGRFIPEFSSPKFMLTETGSTEKTTFQTFLDGDTCGISNGKERSIDIFYVNCSTCLRPRIVSISEPQLCHYTSIIEVPAKNFLKIDGNTKKIRCFQRLEKSDPSGSGDIGGKTEKENQNSTDLRKKIWVSKIKTLLLTANPRYPFLNRAMHELDQFEQTSESQTKTFAKNFSKWLELLGFDAKELMKDENDDKKVKLKNKE